MTDKLRKAYLSTAIFLTITHDCHQQHCRVLQTFVCGFGSIQKENHFPRLKKKEKVNLKKMKKINSFAQVVLEELRFELSSYTQIFLNSKYYSATWSVVG